MAGGLLPVSPEALGAFLALALLVLATPGPSLLLIAATSATLGRRAGLRAVLGTQAGLALIAAAVVGGLGALLARAAGTLGLVRWAGIAWLVLAGVRALVATPDHGAPGRAPAGFWPAFAVSALNPATTPFLIALLPQFVAPGRPAGPQLAVFGLAFLLAAASVDTAVALLAARLGNRRGPAPARRRARVRGVLLLGAGLVLAVSEARLPG